MSPVLRAALPKARICRNFPRAVVYGPQRFQGLGIRRASNYTVSLTFFFGIQPMPRLRLASLICAFSRTNWRRERPSACSSKSTTTQPSSQARRGRNGFGRKWSRPGFTLSLKPPPPALQREGDRLLVEVFTDAEVDQEDLLWLNWCRKFLHAETLSDIVDASGTHILDAAWHGQRSFHKRDRYIWARNPKRITQRHWRLWRETLSSLLVDESHREERRLRSPLGRWTDDLFLWNWVYSPSRNRPYQRMGHGWVLHPKVRSQQRRDLYVHKTFCRFFGGPLPSDVVRATPTFRKFRSLPGVPRDRLRGVVTVDWCPHPPRPDPAPLSSLPLLERWEAERERCSDGVGWVPDRIIIDGSEEELLESLRLGHIRLVGDGSYMHPVGTAATQITTASRRNTIWIICQTSGRISDQSPYRSELMGLYAGLLVISWMRDRLGAGFLSRLRPNVQLACDGEAAIKNGFSSGTLHPTKPQFDLLSSIRCLASATKVNWLPRHVHGHQDDKRPASQLTWWELRNVECDAKAQAFCRCLLRLDHTVAPNPRFFHEPASLFYQGVKCARLDPELVMETFTLPPLLAYWERKRRLGLAQLQEVDWDLMGHTMRNLPSGIQRWVTKHKTGMCGVGKWRKRWGFDSTDACPLCGEPETATHVPRCADPQAAAEWERRVSELADWMTAQDTSPDIAQVILQFLAVIRTPIGSESVVGDVHSRYASRIQAATDSQVIIGVQNTLEGVLSRHWGDLQQQYYDDDGSGRSGFLWLLQLSGQIILLGFQMWEHRNGIQHLEASFSLRPRHRDVNRGIREQFSMGPQDLPSSVAERLRTPLAQVLARSLIERERWLKLMRVERRIARVAVQRQRDLMKRHFPPLSSPRPKRRRLLPSSENGAIWVPTSSAKRRRMGSPRPTHGRVLLQSSLASFLPSR